MRNLLFHALLYVCNHIVNRIPSHALRLWFYRRFMKLQIGMCSAIFMGAWLDGIGSFVMQGNSVINQRCRLDNRGGIAIGRNVSISAEVCILTADHDPQGTHFDGRQKPVVIEDYVMVGTRAMILPGVTLGEGSVVGAGSVVTQDVAPYTIVSGIPAKPVGMRSRDLDYTLDYRRLFF